jgi:hypothetical protein
MLMEIAFNSSNPRWTYSFLDVNYPTAWAVYLGIIFAHVTFFYIVYALWLAKRRFMRKYAPGFEMRFEEVFGPEASLGSYASVTKENSTRFLSFESSGSYRSAPPNLSISLLEDRLLSSPRSLNHAEGR